MPRKRFDDDPYNPISVDLARDVATAGRPSPTTQPAIRAHEPRATDTHKEMFEAGARRSDIRPSSPQHSLKLPPPPPPRDLTITKRFVLSRDEDDALNEFLLRLQKRVGTKVPLSVVVRAAVAVAMQSEHSLHEQLKDWPIRFPSTHDQLGLAAFEAEWIRCLTSAIRRLPRQTPP